MVDFFVDAARVNTVKRFDVSFGMYIFQEHATVYYQDQATPKRYSGLRKQECLEVLHGIAFVVISYYLQNQKLFFFLVFFSEMIATAASNTPLRCEGNTIKTTFLCALCGVVFVVMISLPDMQTGIHSNSVKTSAPQFRNSANSIKTNTQVIIKIYSVPCKKTVIFLHPLHCTYTNVYDLKLHFVMCMIK